jgi:hypothetical protein
VTFIVTLLALAAIGAATLFFLVGLAAIGVLSWACRWAIRFGKAWKVRRQLRDLEVGTCDGLKGWQIGDVVEECWDPSIHS